MKSGIITLIIGTVPGAKIAYELPDKKIEFNKEKNNAMNCLKIELTRINTKDIFVYFAELNTFQNFKN